MVKMIKQAVLTALHDMSNPYEEDECVASLKEEKIEIRDAKYIQKSGYAYHVSVTVPNTKLWMEKLKSSLGISFVGSRQDVRVINDQLEFGIPVAISSVASSIIESLRDRYNINVNLIPEKTWELIQETKEYEAAEKEIARQFAASDIMAALKLSC